MIKNIKHFLAASTLLIFSTICNAQYKCINTGKTSFQDTPCQTGGQKLDIKPATGNAPKEEAVKLEDKSLPSSAERTKNHANKLENERLQREKQYEINRLKEAKFAIHRELDLKIAELKNKKLSARNNLAGATWEQSISTEMQAITDSAKIKLSDIDTQIITANKDLDQLKTIK